MESPPGRAGLQPILKTGVSATFCPRSSRLLSENKSNGPGRVAQRIGRSLQWDAEKEEIIGDPEATKLLRREYRAPWKYPV